MLNKLEIEIEVIINDENDEEKCVVGKENKKWIGSVRIIGRLINW